MQQIVNSPPPTVSVLGLPLHVLNDYSGWLLDRIYQKHGGHVVTLNAEMAMQAEKTPQLIETIRHADLVIPDGAGVVLYLKLLGRKAQRCPGIELAETLLTQMGHDRLGSVFFYGGAPGVAEQAAQVWQQRSPGLTFAGVQHGFLTSEEQIAFKQQLQDLQPQLILVGLGVPRQEFWIAEHRHLCPKAIWIGVGGSFDIWAGTKTRAPGWLRNNNLEWLYRLYQEPWRWKRMMALPHFAWRSLIYRFTGKASVTGG